MNETTGLNSIAEARVSPSTVEAIAWLDGWDEADEADFREDKNQPLRLAGEPSPLLMSLGSGLGYFKRGI